MVGGHIPRVINPKYFMGLTYYGPLPHILEESYLSIQGQVPQCEGFFGADAQNFVRTKNRSAPVLPRGESPEHRSCGNRGIDLDQNPLSRTTRDSARETKFCATSTRLVSIRTVPR